MGRGTTRPGLVADQTVTKSNHLDSRSHAPYGELRATQGPKYATERRKDLDRLRTTDRQKDEFLAMLGHELRNPLAAMSNALMCSKRDLI